MDLRKKFSFLQPALLLLILAGVSFGQVMTGTLTGTVVDPSDAVIPGATIIVVDLATGRQFEAVSDNSGVFTLPNLPYGFFKASAQAPGFTTAVIERVQVNVAQTAKVLLKLPLATVGTEVVVLSEQFVVQTESVELKNSVDRRQIMELPLPTRNPLDLVRTMAGIATPTGSGIADAFVHGLRGNSTNITQDGINVADNFVKTSSFFALSAPTVDTVGEFNVSVGGIGVDAGFGAAQVNIRTQRGSNEFHGSLFWFQRTNALNANTFFNNSSGVARPYQLQNRIGASAGGPVYLPKLYNGKNRTWIFGAYEAFREPLARERTRTVLTANARQGLFTYTPTAGGAPQTVNLLTLGTIGTSTVSPSINANLMTYYNSIVPADGLTDAGCAGGDSVNIRCFRFNLPGKSVQDRYTLRVDHQLFQSHVMEFVFNQADFDSVPDLLNGTEPMFPKSIGGGQGSRRQVLTWALQSILNNRMTNEFRVGYTRAPVRFDTFNDFGATGGYQINLPRVTNPTLVTTNMPQGRNTPVRQVLDNFAWVRGRHTMRFGGEYRQIVANSYFYNTVVPRATIGSNSVNPHGITSAKFPGGISSGDLSRATDIFTILTGLLGTIDQGFNHTSPTSGFVAGVPRSIDPIQHNISFYFQDGYKLRPNLTLQYGIRWEYQGVFDLRNKLVLLPKDGMASFWGPAGVNNLFNPLATPAMTDTLLDFAGARNGRPVLKRDLNNFAPYFGFAWDPWKDGKSSIRASFTSHYTQDGFTLHQLASTGNTGLFSVVANTTPTGIYSHASNPKPPAPVATFPVSQKANFIANTSANLWHFDSEQTIPYVLSWHLSVQRQLWKRFAIEARYVGNHAVKLYRSWNINEIDVLNNGLLKEFKNAQNNLTISGTRFDNQNLPGQVALPVFEKLFTGLALSSGFSNSTFVTNLREHQIGRLFDSIRRSNTYRTNREANFPLNFFVANPFANQANLVDNSSWSYYHGLEVELVRRFSSGLFMQSNYTWSKVLTDTRFMTSQNSSQFYRSLSNRALDKNRASFDVTHSFTANFLYPLPFGSGKWLAGNAGPFLNKLIGGWNIQGMTRWSSGSPFTIASDRWTTGALVGTTAVLRNMTARELQKHIGTYRHGDGVFWLNPASGLVTLSGATSRAVFCSTGQTTPCFDHPGVNEEGNLPFLGFNSPSFFGQDFSVTKRTYVPSVSEAFNFEIRMEFFNVLNHPNFTSLQSQIDSSSFGKLTSIVDSVRGGGVTSRIIQWALRINW